MTTLEHADPYLLEGDDSEEPLHDSKLYLDAEALAHGSTRSFHSTSDDSSYASLSMIDVFEIAKTNLPEDVQQRIAALAVSSQDTQKPSLAATDQGRVLGMDSLVLSRRSIPLLGALSHSSRSVQSEEFGADNSGVCPDPTDLGEREHRGGAFCRRRQEGSETV